VAPKFASSDIGYAIMHLPQPRSKSLKRITHKHSFELAEHASPDFGHVNIVSGEAPAIDAYGWRFLYGHRARH
jgi:hypothetical protein